MHEDEIGFGFRQDVRARRAQPGRWQPQIPRMPQVRPLPQIKTQIRQMPQGRYSVNIPGIQGRINRVRFSLEQSGRELDSLSREVKQYGFWLGTEVPGNGMSYGLAFWSFPSLKSLISPAVSNAVKNAVTKVVQAPAAAAKAIKEAPKKIETFVQNKVIAPVQNTAMYLNKISAPIQKGAGSLITGTINGLKDVKNTATNTLGNAKDLINKGASIVYDAGKKVITGGIDLVKTGIDKGIAVGKTIYDAGLDLKKKLEEEGKKKLEQAAALAKKVAEGLSALKKNLTSRITNTINGFITTGKNLLNSSKSKLTSSAAHYQKAKAALARVKAKISASMAAKKKMGFSYASFMDFVDESIKSDPDYIQFGYEVQTGKADANSAQGEANGGKAAVTDIGNKAGAGVTVSAEDAANLGNYVGSEVSKETAATKGVWQSIWDAAVSILKSIAEYLGLYTTLENEMKQAIADREAADKKLKQAADEKAIKDKAEEEARLKLQKEQELLNSQGGQIQQDQQKVLDAQNAINAASTDLERQKAQADYDAAQKKLQADQLAADATNRRVLADKQDAERAARDSDAADAKFRDAAAEKLRADAAVQAAADRAIREGKTAEEAEAMLDSIRTQPVPEWKPPTYTPEEQNAAPLIASSSAVDKQTKDAATLQDAYQDLASKAGTSMAVQENLPKVQSVSDINAIGAAVEEGLEEGAPEGEGEPSKLPYIAAGLAVLGAGYYLLTKKKGGSYARA